MMTPQAFLEILQGKPPDEFSQGDILPGEWPFGRELIFAASNHFLQGVPVWDRIAIGVLNQADVNGRWYRVPGY